MNMDDGQLIARFQWLTTELPIEKRLGQRRPELTDELYQTWLELDQRRLKETPEYRNVMLRADRHAFWLAELVKLSSRPDAAPSHTSNGPVGREPDIPQPSSTCPSGEHDPIGTYDSISSPLAHSRSTFS